MNKRRICYKALVIEMKRVTTSIAVSLEVKGEQNRCLGLSEHRNEKEYKAKSHRNAQNSVIENG